MRLILLNICGCSHYIKTQLKLEERDTATWKWLNEGQFSIVKSRLPFVGIGVVHAGEQQNEMLKVSGGLRGIATNANARNRFFATAPILRALCSASETKKHNISMSKARKQEARIEKLTKSIELHLNPFSSEDTGTLRNRYTNAVVKEEYTGIINFTELGKKSLEKFTQERLMTHSKIPLWSTVGRNKFPNFHQAMSHKSKEKMQNQVKVESNLLAKFIIASRSSRDIDEREVVSNFELGNYPPSLMHYRVLHECTNKADIGKELNYIYENYTAANTESNQVQDLAVKILIFDGMAIFFFLIDFFSGKTNNAMAWQNNKSKAWQNQKFTKHKAILDIYIYIILAKNK